MPDTLASIEQRIVELKSEMNRMARDRNLAYHRGRPEEARRHHLSALEAELRNVETLASYVGTVSPAVARDLALRHAWASRRFAELRPANDAEALRRWVTQELAPLVNKTEQAAHLIATSVRIRKGRPSKPFGWSAPRRP